MADQKQNQAGALPKGGDLESQIELDIGEMTEVTVERAAGPARRSSGNAFVDFYNNLNAKFQSAGGVKLKDKMVFYNLLATMVKAGITLVKGLEILAQQTQNPKLKNIITEVAYKVERGETFSSALAQYSDTFNDVEIGMVSAGEISGNLNDILKQVGIGLEKSLSVQQKVKGAMMYPAIIFSVVGLVIFAMLAFIMPKLKELFGSTGKDLPALTSALITAGEFMKSYWYLIIGGFVLLVALFIVWKKTPKGRYAFDSAILKFPIFGDMTKKMAIARFSRILSNLIKSGIPIVKALHIAAHSSGNEVYKEKILSAAEDVQRGIPLGENLSGCTDLFEPMVIYMINIGEQSAQLDQMCSKLADFYEEEVDEKTKGFSKALEPMIMVVVGVVVGTLVYAIMGPIMNLADISTVT